MIWDYDGLWQKAKQYVDRAYREEREGSLFAFWSSLSLEFLARATLARIHPALLADPSSPEHLLYAFGIEKTTKPKSIAITTVFLRCTNVCPEFTKDVSDACTTITERRNSELHSGELAFEGIPTSNWLAQFYKACSILLKFQEKSLADLLPPEEVAAANAMIDGRPRTKINRPSRDLNTRLAVHNCAMHLAQQSVKMSAIFCTCANGDPNGSSRLLQFPLPERHPARSGSAAHLEVRPR